MNQEKRQYRSYREDFFREDNTHVLKSSEALSHAQVIALMLQKTAIFINLGAIIAITANIVPINGPTEKISANLLFPIAIFLFGTVTAIGGGFASYKNLNWHSEYHEIMRTIVRLEVDERYYGLNQPKSKKLCEARNEADEKRGLIQQSHTLALALIILSYASFFFACYNYAR